MWESSGSLSFDYQRLEMIPSGEESNKRANPKSASQQGQGHRNVVGKVVSPHNDTESMDFEELETVVWRKVSNLLKSCPTAKY